MERTLDREGYRVVCCHSGKEACRHLSDSVPDLLIVDLLMPEMDGVEVIATVKREAQWRNLGVIAVTGAQVSREHAEVLERFSIPTLSKPWRIEELSACMEETLAGRTIFRTTGETEEGCHARAHTDDSSGR